jgi:hypothetical protein
MTISDLVRDRFSIRQVNRQTGGVTGLFPVVLDVMPYVFRLITLFVATSLGCSLDFNDENAAVSADVGVEDARPVGDRGFAPIVDASMPPDASERAEFIPAPAGMYRLTQRQYRNIITDVFGPEIVFETALEEDTQIHGFSAIGGSELTISARAVEQFESAALEIAQQVWGDEEQRARWFPCPSPTMDPECLEAGILRLGYRLWRRPLTEVETTTLMGLVERLQPLLRDEWLSLRYGLSAILQSPHFLFRVERGEIDPVNQDQLRYTNFEMASRLAFLFWNRGPDADLLEQANAGVLTTDVGLREAAARLAADPRARQASLAFFDEYLHLDRLHALEKDRDLFPLMSDSLGTAMHEEILRMIERVVFDEGSDVHDLLTTRTTSINNELAGIYQVASPGGWTPFEFPVNSPRAGLLTTAGFLAMNAHNTVTSPTFRGEYIQNKMFCFDIPPPPPGVVTSLELVESNGPVTTRQKLAQHRADPSCAGCHVYMDPLGLALENFDPIGMWRTTEHGLPIDASGEIDGEPFVGGKALGRLVAERQTFGECVTRQLYRHGMAHLETRGEEVAIADLQARFRDTGYRFEELLIELAMSEAFRRPGGSE